MNDYGQLSEYLDKISVEYKTDEKTSSYVSFRAGGTAKIIAFPDNIGKLCLLLKYISDNKVNFFVLGKGTNTFFSDDCYNGIVICTIRINNISCTENTLICDCGAKIISCSLLAYEKSLSGLEFAYGIPGSIGGAVYMNAAAYGSSVSNIIKDCTVFDLSDKKIIKLAQNELKFRNKYSVLQDNTYQILLSCSIELEQANKDDIYSKMKSNLLRRNKSQPVEFPSAGSVFKRPSDSIFASRLIDEAGLKGYSIGDAQVSEKHAGFIINKGNASSEEINDLIQYVQKTVYEKYNILLEREVIFVKS